MVREQSVKGEVMPWTSVSKRIVLTVLTFLAFFSVALYSGSARALGDREGKRIEYLIASVEGLSGARFIRNGTEYDGKQAASHLRMKLKRAGGRVSSAEDFITLCASKSYLSGKPYLIAFSDGKTVPAAQFFRKKLLEYRPTR
jgi:hypothetical protein